MNIPAEVDKELRYHYTYGIELDGNAYAELLALVMRYGTGAGEGGSTSSRLRRALVAASVTKTDTCATLDRQESVETK